MMTAEYNTSAVVVLTMFLATALLGCASLHHLPTNNPDVDMVDSVERYILASLDEDAVAAVRELHPGLVLSRGGSSAVIEQQRRTYAIDRLLSLKPRLIEIGRPIVFEEAEDRFAWVPIRAVTPGFPNDIITTSYYAVASTRKERKWYVLNLSCREQAWAKSVFRDYPFDRGAARFTSAIRVLELGAHGELVRQRDEGG